MRRHQPGAAAAPTCLARLALALALAACVGSAIVTTPAEAGAAGIVPPSDPPANISPQVTPVCNFAVVDDTSASCIDSVLHDINRARWVEGLGPMVLPSDYATDPVPLQQLIIADEERGDRGLPQFSGLDPVLNALALTAAQNNADPVVPPGDHPNGWGSNFAKDYTPLSADFAWMYDDGPGGTNLLCTPQDMSGCWGHRDNILGSWTTNSSQTAQMGDADTSAGQYTQVFMNQTGTPDTPVDTITPGALPTPATPAPPDVVRLSPASTSNAAAGTPVTIEGNYFNTTATPQVFFGGVAASNVHVNWNGELTADAPPDPAGTAWAQVVVTVTTSAGSSTPTGTTQMNVFTYAPPTTPPPAAPVPPHGYWLVGSDGGIFTFGSAQFYGSTGSLHLQRPVVGITPTADRAGYWLVASDGGIFAFGDSGFYGSIPGSGLKPAGSGQPHSLNAPIVGMVPSHDGGGYFMVASDGGVFAFGDARFEGSCPGIGGCRGAAVSVVPDATGNGYWVVTNSGAVYTFGDAVDYGQPGTQSSSITSAAAAPDGGGYWILDAAGQVFPFGNTASLGGMPPGSAGGFNPASAIFATSDGGGYWVVTAAGKVSSFGDAPADGDMSATHLNGPIVAASGS